MTRHGRTRTARLAAAALAAAAAIAGDAAAAPEEGAVRESVNVRVMDVDVVVTDAAGRPVPDLARDAFQIRVDRRPVDIDYFAAVRNGVVSRSDLESLSPDLVLNPGEREKTASVPRHFLLWIDEASLTPGRRRKALPALRDFLARLGPADEATIVAERGRPETLAGWTSRPEALTAGLDAVSPSAAGGLRRTERERQAIREIELSGRVERETRARLYEEEVYEETKKTLTDMTDSLSLLGDKAGKKVMVVLSEGFELQPGAAMLAVAARNDSPLTFRRDVTPELRRFIDRANALETTVFTIDARGIPAGDGAEDAPPAERSLSARPDRETGLARMADETGGEAVRRDNDLAAGLATVFRDVSTYYSLGVSLRNVAPNASHRVDVVVSRPGLRIRARRTYASEDEEARVEDRVRATLLTSSSYADLGPVVRVGPASREGRQAVVTIDVEVPASDLTFLPDAGHVTARAVYYFAALDDRGEETPLTRTTQSFTLAPADAHGAKPLVERVSLKLRKGNYRLVVNVLDAETGKMGTARTAVRAE